MISVKHLLRNGAAVKKMSDCKNKSIVTYSRKAAQRVSDAQVEAITYGSSASSLDSCNSVADSTSIKSKSGTLHAFLQKLPPSVGVKRKPVSKLFSFCLPLRQPAQTFALNMTFRIAQRLRRIRPK